jgi:hypothetical protein
MTITLVSVSVPPYGLEMPAPSTPALSETVVPASVIVPSLKMPPP